MIRDRQRFWAQPGRDHQGFVPVVSTVRIANDSSRAIEAHRRSVEHSVSPIIEVGPQGERDILMPLTMVTQQAPRQGRAIVWSMRLSAEEGDQPFVPRATCRLGSA